MFENAYGDLICEEYQEVNMQIFQVSSKCSCWWEKKTFITVSKFQRVSISKRYLLFKSYKDGGHLSVNICSEVGHLLGWMPLEKVNISVLPSHVNRNNPFYL